MAASQNAISSKVAFSKILASSSRRAGETGLATSVSSSSSVEGGGERQRERVPEISEGA